MRKFMSIYGNVSAEGSRDKTLTLQGLQMVSWRRSYNKNVSINCHWQISIKRTIFVHNTNAFIKYLNMVHKHALSQAKESILWNGLDSLILLIFIF